MAPTSGLWLVMWKKPAGRWASSRAFSSMPWAAEPKGTLTTLLEVGERIIWRLDVDDDAVAGALHIVGDDGYQAAFAVGVGFEGVAVHDQRVVPHHAELEFVGDHAVGDGWAGGKVLPVQLVVDVGVFAVMREEFFQQVKFLNDDAGGDGVGCSVLRPYTDRQGRAGQCRSCGEDRGGRGGQYESSAWWLLVRVSMA